MAYRKRRGKKNFRRGGKSFKKGRRGGKRLRTYKVSRGGVRL